VLHPGVLFRYVTRHRSGLDMLLYVKQVSLKQRSRTQKDTDKDDRPGEAIKQTLPVNSSSVDRRQWKGEPGRTGAVKLRPWHLHQAGQVKHDDVLLEFTRGENAFYSAHTLTNCRFCLMWVEPDRWRHSEPALYRPVNNDNIYTDGIYTEFYFNQN